MIHGTIFGCFSRSLISLPEGCSKDFDTSANLNMPAPFYIAYGSLRFTLLSNAISFSVPEYSFLAPKIWRLCVV